jgi:NADPH-dependent 2,4-dienoyl-CoA reductase/sulfur reductase-like enzyme
MTAASQARRRRGADELEIVAFERGEHTSFSACGIPYFIAGDVDALDDLVARTPAEHRARAIDVHLRHEVVAIDLARRRVQVADLDAGTERWEPFDSLVYATGSVPIRPDLPGSDADGIFGVQTLDDGALVRRVLEADPEPRRAVVVGGGYIGLEMAEAFVNRGAEVTVVTATPQPMATLDEDMGALVADAMRKHGIDVRCGERAVAFEKGAVHTSGSGRLDADLVELPPAAGPDPVTVRRSYVDDAAAPFPAWRDLLVPGAPGARADVTAPSEPFLAAGTDRPQAAALPSITFPV